jgi:uncharacterized membrane protein
MTILISALLMIVVDFLFLWTMGPTFQRLIQKIQGSPLQLHYRGIIPCYLFLIFVLNYFILIPHKSVLDAFLLGICIYGVYETTMYSTFNDWPLQTVMIDTIWGGILFALVTWLTYRLNNLFR